MRKKTVVETCSERKQFKNVIFRVLETFQASWEGREERADPGLKENSSVIRNLERK